MPLLRSVDSRSMEEQRKHNFYRSITRRFRVGWDMFSWAFGRSVVDGWMALIFSSSAVHLIRLMLCLVVSLLLHRRGAQKHQYMAQNQ